ncbi:MAG: DUF4149 domain-containing protein [Verrucomicrobiota bacterium]|nr:DUF4149 domain-containing protein [Limisphaera sp.]MDW8380873.1 DUF4149 domain-containing protein [Verrucomicrobiota bacterium]
MIGFVRFLGLANAAIWLGATLFFTVGAGPALFSDDIRRLLGEANYPYFSGAIAQIVIARLIRLQILCAGVALVHLLLEWAWLRRPLRRLETYCWAALAALTLLGAFVWQPEIRRLHRIKYAVNVTHEQRQVAAERLRSWHGSAQLANLCLLGGLAFYLSRMARPVDGPRFVPTYKWRS